jgi:calcineurin-like phosphoesterase family protein
MEELWKAHVAPTDEVYVGGDFAYKARREWHVDPEELLDRLPGVKHLIRGNHDLEFKIDKLEGWASVRDYVEIRHEGKRFVMSHYPMETWRNAHHGWIMLHGHTHGNLHRTIAHRFDIGVDATKIFYPVDILHYAELAAQQEYEPQDHHGE